MRILGRCCGWTSLSGFNMREAASIYCTVVACYLVILLAVLQGLATPESPFPYHIPLDPKGTLELSWNVSYAQEDIHFQLRVHGLRAGVLFGMSDRGELENADLVVLWTDGDTAYFADAWSDQKGQIHLDPQQDYQLLQAQRTPEGLTLLFKRPFGTCDPKDYLIEDDTVHLVYGILEEPFRSLEAINISGLQTGLQRVQLLKPDLPIPAVPSDTRTMEIRAPDVQVPGQETTYWCYVTELPAGFSKHHIVMYEPIVTEGNEALVHHMEVFQCAAAFESIPHFSGPCDSKMKPDRLNFCRHVLAAWALGAKAFYYPEEAGLAFGGPGSSRYLRLEVHYHNPLKLEALPPQEAHLQSGLQSTSPQRCVQRPARLLRHPPALHGLTASLRCGHHGAGAGVHARDGHPPTGERLRPHRLLHRQVHSAGTAALRGPHLRLSAPHALDGEEGGHRAGPRWPREGGREQGQPLQPPLPGDPYVEEARVRPPGGCAHHFLHLQYGGQEAGHCGRLWDPGGDVCQLRALLPPDAAGALQECCGRWLPAEVLPPGEQVQQRGRLHLPAGLRASAVRLRALELLHPRHAQGPVRLRAHLHALQQVLRRPLPGRVEPAAPA